MLSLTIECQGALGFILHFIGFACSVANIPFPGILETLPTSMMSSWRMLLHKQGRGLWEGGSRPENATGDWMSLITLKGKTTAFWNTLLEGD